MSIQGLSRISIAAMLLLALVPAVPPAAAMGGTIGCTVMGNGTCTFICPIAANGWVMRVSVTGATTGVVVTGTCGTLAVTCTADATGECARTGKTIGTSGFCSFLGSSSGVGTCTLLFPAHTDKLCPHFSPHSHTYGTGGSVGARSDTVTGGDEVGAGVVTVFETNTADCNNDGIAGDYDGDWETGVGGGFFGYGPWANEATCNYGLTIHGGTATVSDVVFGSDIAFVIGADDTSGPVVTVDPVTGEVTCETSGSITPGDPTTDPTADADDCLTDVYVGSGTTCGAGGDGGYWVFLSGALVSEGSGGAGVSNAPTAGTITA